MTDDNGNVLDVYTVNPATAEGRNKSNEEVNLPQTGITSTRNWIVFIGGILMIALGSFAVLGSGIISHRKHEQ